MSKLIIEECTIQIGNRSVSYLTCGEGPVLVLIHGGLGSAKINWESHLPILGEKFKIYAPDTRGHGNSTNPEDIWSYKQFAKDLQEFIIMMQFDNPYVCGYSDGGITALEHAIQFSGSVPKYTICGANKETTQEMISELEVFGFSPSGDVNFDKFESYVKEYVGVLQQMHVQRGADYWRTLVAGNARLWTRPFSISDSQLSGITAELLIITGDRDELIPIEQPISLYQLTNRSRLAVSQNTGHGLPGDRMDWFINELIEFFLPKE